MPTRPPLKSLPLLLIPLVLAGCFSPLREAGIQVPQAFSAAGSPVPASLPAEALDRWWLLFGDPQLTGLVEQALAAAPDARSALAVLSEAQANRDQALSRFDPKGNLTGSATRQHSKISDVAAGAGAGVGTGIGTGAGATVAGGSTIYTGAFNPSWELDLFGRRGAAADAADADLDLARFTYEASRQSLATNVAGNLFDARGLAVQLAEARDTERIAAELARIGARRVQAGIGAEVDSASLDADAATAAANATAIEAQLAASKRTLLVLLGRGTDPLPSLQIEARLGSAPPVPAIAPGALLQRRPDLRQAEARVRSAAGTLRLDELELFPTFNLLPGGSLTRVAGSAGYTSTLWSLGAGLSLPILDRPRLQAQIRAQGARGEQAVIAYEKAVQTAYGEAETTLTNYAADQSRLVRLTEAERRARSAFEAQRRGYDAGFVELTTLLASERTWRANRTALSSLQTTTLRDAVNAFRALGGGWSPDAPAPVAPVYPEESKR